MSKQWSWFWDYPFDIYTQVKYNEGYVMYLNYTIYHYWGILFGLFFIFLLLKHYSKTSTHENSQSLITEDHLHSIQDNHSSTNKADHSSSTNKAHQIISILTSLSFHLSFCMISLLYLSYFSFGMLGAGTFYEILGIGAISLGVIIPGCIWQSISKESKGRKNIILMKIVLGLVWIYFSFYLIDTYKGGCLAAYNDYYGEYIEAGYQYSTTKSRIKMLKPVCLDQEVCHLYVTLPEIAFSQAIFNIHTGIKVESLQLQMIDQQNNTISINSNSPLKMHHLDIIGQRNVHSILVTGLKPSCLYAVKVLNESGFELRKTNYRSPPDEVANEMRVAVGGDVAMNSNATRLALHLGEYDPDVIFVGGDIAYDDGMQSCYYSWDNFYWIFETLFLQVNKTIPLVLSVGNHDVGYCALANRNIKYNIQQMPLYFLFNPQANPTPGKTFQHLEDRLSFHHHVIGSSIFLFLDSGYVSSFDSQTDYIRTVSKQYNHLSKFANYHNPMYPSCADWNPKSNDMLSASAGKDSWQPLFDAFNYVAAFEHHMHRRKITKKIRNETIVNDNEQGVRYVGDGSWGIEEPPCSGDWLPSDQTIQYFEDYDKIDPRHVWQVTLKRKESQWTVTYRAVDMAGAEIYAKTDAIIAPTQKYD